MKNVFLLIFMTCVVLSSAIGQQEAINKFFEQYRDNQDFTQVNISPKMFELFSQMDDSVEMDAETKEMIKSLKGLKILSTDKEPTKYYNEFTTMVSTSGYEELMTIRDDDANVKFLIKDSDGGNIVDELLLLVGGTDSFVLMSFAGKIPLDKVGKLAKNINISGAEHLDKLKK